MAKKQAKKTPEQKAAGRARTKARRARAAELVAMDFIAHHNEREWVATHKARTLAPITMDAPAVNMRAPLFAANLKKVCRTTKVGSKCKKGSSNMKPKDLGLERGYSSDELEAACEVEGGKFIPGRTKHIRAGKMELDFLSPKQAKKLNTLPGPNLRLCKRDDERGFLVPVTDPQHAVRVSDAFLKCVDEKKKNMPHCALEAAQKATGKTSPPLGGLRYGSLLGGLFNR